MSLISAISNSLSGLSAIQADMQVISSNVTNAGRADYTRKNVILTSNSTGYGTGGVTIAGYGRAEDANLERLVRNALADNGLRSTQSDYLGRIQTLLGSDQDSPQLTTAMADFASAWRQYAASPEDDTAKQDVIFKGQTLAREVNRAAAGLDQITADAKADMATATDTLNTSLKRIEELNNQIVNANTSGQSAVDLMDQRDTKVKKIAELVKVNVYNRDDGRISIYTPSGSALLDVKATQFGWDGTNFTIQPAGSSAASILPGGKVEALLGMLDRGSSAATLNDPGKASVYKLQEQLDEIVDLFTNPSGTFATAYSSGTTATGELGSGFFTGSTRYGFAVNSNLTDGTNTLKQASAQAVADDMDLTTRTISAGEIDVTNASYTDFTNAIVYTQNQNTKHISELATVYSTQKDDYTKRLQDQVGVNVDEEIVRLTQLQNNYAAIGRVISTVQSMLQILDSLAQ